MVGDSEKHDEDGGLAGAIGTAPPVGPCTAIEPAQTAPNTDNSGIRRWKCLFEVTGIVGMSIAIDLGIALYWGMGWPAQCGIIGCTCLVVAGFALYKRRHDPSDQGPWRPEMWPVVFGFVMPLAGKALYRLSLLTFNNHFRKDKGIHAWYVDFYALASCALAIIVTCMQLGPSLWLISVWRITSLLIVIASMGLFRSYIREIRGDGPSPSSPRIVILGFVNWIELVALFALLYQAIHGKGMWLYESFTTQVTMSHSTPINCLEKAVIILQISASIFLLTTVVGLYVGLVGNLPIRDSATTAKGGQ